ncbi:hypothetical protein PsorP6_001683 [Peronosclerospora sorghi]|uniref:Uncharacterized protein n=1 Tax=Peronosclerospora sorghi TaxID=230839 RepID=A0ACC0WWM6_9STRA|nr:hypothetical protein PsorP6_001683 [Peronosclerospora sorghi]
MDSEAETTVETIAGRTRTKCSLVDVPLDTLEACLPLDHEATGDTAADREYQRFLSSLVPHEQENLSFLDEEDEEYRPDDDDDGEHEDDEARRGVSKKELTDLLLDSTHVSKVPVRPLGVLEKRTPDDGRARNERPGPPPLPRSASEPQAPASKPHYSEYKMAAIASARARGISQPQCIQLASQMHKHLQLLLQTYHFVAQRGATSEVTECRAMMTELHDRGEQALRFKNELLSKLNPGTQGGERTMEAGDASAPLNMTLPSHTEDTSATPDAPEHLVARRRVTRSLTAAHAAVAHPSMFELVGSSRIEELAAELARGCSIEERDRVMQEHMLQVDAHLLSAQSRRKSRKGYSSTEDTLLAHGVQRFGTHADAWDEIQRHLLPTKSTPNLRHRYKYLSGPKTGMNAVKAVQVRGGMAQHNHRWLLEEDVRIARGLVALHKEKYPFSRLSKRYLPHRTRLEIRKRWERLTAKFRSDLGEIGLDAPTDDSPDLAVAMKAYLEDKLQTRMLEQHGEAAKKQAEATMQLPQLDPSGKSVDGRSRDVDVPSGGPKTPSQGMDALSCRAKHLHPALFFSSWSFISPATLLNGTCKHNWPSFMEEPNGTDGRAPPKSSTTPDVAPVAARGSTTNELDTFLPIAMPADLMAQQDEEEEDEEEEEDSDYEHDELLSSESAESESDFEQMEFTDDDDDDDRENAATSADAFSFLSNERDERPRGSAGAITSSLEHPLRLQNLSQPHNERMQRALAALERRMVGKSSHDPDTALDPSTPATRRDVPT